MGSAISAGLELNRPGDTRPQRLTSAELLLFAPLGIGVLLISMNKLRPFSVITYSDLLLVSALLIVLVRYGATRSILRVPGAYILSFAVLLLGAVLGCVADNSMASLLSIGQLALAAFVFPLIVAWHSAVDQKLPMLLIYAWTAGVVFNAIVGIGAHHGFQFPGIYDYYANSRWDGYRISGITTHPNMLGLFSAMTIPFVLGLALQARTLVIKLGLAFAALLLLYAIDLTGSRAAISAILLLAPLQLLLCLTVVAGLRTAITRLAPLFIAGLGVLLYQVRGSAGSSALSRLFKEEGIATSDNVRSGLRETALSDFFDSPLLGAGYEHIRDAHSLFLQFLQSGGLIGTAGLLLYLFAITAAAVRLNRFLREESVFHRIIGISICFSIITWLIISMAQNAVIERGVYFPIAVLLGLYFSRLADARSDAQTIGFAAQVRP